MGFGQVGSLVARARVSSRGGGTFSGTAVLTANAPATLKASAAGSVRVLLSGKAGVAAKSSLVQSVTPTFQTRFFPAMRGVLTTTVNLGSSAGTAIMFKVPRGAQPHEPASRVMLGRRHRRPASSMPPLSRRRWRYQPQLL
ncbi:hypothetical protein MA20_30975 [Bradyrhizobium japonicum]|uniref:Uncharacterized protein n=1 Tax=Bradyrhizobium japonicum TaxID=375 RepID=A0A0A3XR79_BRAJP|nr:hypothetical protein MA20_30975 [Bradyrhizobium japonicum]